MFPSNNFPGMERPLARLLIVDDDPMCLIGTRELLAREGYEVVTSTSPLEAMELVKGEPFAVVITDHRMPSLTGLELLAVVAQLQPDASRILMTGVLDMPTLIQAIGNGEIFRFIIKPWLREELLVTVQNAVQRHELVRQNAVLARNVELLTSKVGNLTLALDEKSARTGREPGLAGADATAAGGKDVGEFCARLLEAFYPILGLQARRARELCGAMGNELGMPEEERRMLERAALICDVGLLSVPRELIRKAQGGLSTLSEGERAQYRQHPVLGQEFMRWVDPSPDLGRVVRSHHERFDGLGYPDGLVGEAIPWAARLLAVGTLYAESQASEREVLEEIQAGAGTQFDPMAVRAFFRVKPQVSGRRVEREIAISELVPGMVLAKGIYTSCGALLASKGQPLNRAQIDALRGQTAERAADESLLVYC